MPKNSVVVVSEPLDQSGELWQEMPSNTFSSIAAGNVTIEQLSLT